MRYRNILIALLTFCGPTLAGDLPVGAGVDDAVADFVNVQFKMQLVFPFAISRSIRPGTVILARTANLKSGFLDLSEDQICPFSGLESREKLRDPIKRQPFVASPPFAGSSSLFGLSSDLTKKISHLEMSADEGTLYAVDSDLRDDRIASAKSNCRNPGYGQGADRGYFVNTAREGLLRFTMTFLDETSAAEARKAFSRSADARQFSVEVVKNELHILADMPIIFGVTTRALSR
jgi:hypothetical protein